MKILVTGGAGFVGSHLSERLLDEGHEVVVLDNLSTGAMDNIGGLQGRPGFEYVIGSVRDQSLVNELVDQCELTIHLAAAVGVKLIIEKPSYSMHTNINGTENVLHAAAIGRKKVIIASTSEVYGKATKSPFSEGDDLVLGPPSNLRWSYACAKVLDECLALAYAQEGKVTVVIARLFNTTGPRQTGRYGMVLPNFVAQALKGEPITVYGTGDQTRCFAHVKDVVEAMVRLISAPAAVGEIFNIGSDREISIRELAELVKKLAGSSSPIVTVPYSEAYSKGFEDMVRRVPSVSKLEQAIGYRPRTTLEEIISDVIAEKRATLGLAVRRRKASGR